jgi:hypothetical protein
MFHTLDEADVRGKRDFVGGRFAEGDIVGSRSAALKELVEMVRRPTVFVCSRGLTHRPRDGSVV